jgi:probable F420-dependent oxidoreductase
MKFWISTPWVEVEEMIEIAKMAEDIGFEGIMGADHGFVAKDMAAKYPYSDDGAPPITGDMPYPDVFTSITAMAMVTERLKFSNMVYVLPLRNPIESAKAAANVARISNNRLKLGVGVGWMKEEFETYHIDFHKRGKIMDECIEIMRTLWQGGYQEYHGEFYDFDPIQIVPVPSNNDVPFYFGGVSEPARHRAARVGEGWIGAGNTLDEVPGLLSDFDNWRRDCGRENTPFETIIPLMGEGDMMNIEGLKQAEELGMTSAVSGFRDYKTPLAEKRQMLEMFAEHVMKPLQ